MVNSTLKRAETNLFENKLTFHPVSDDFLGLLGRALSKPVVSEQYCELISVHQLPRHKGQRTKRHLVT